MRYIALLRGINVGGNNIIKMADLRACFEQAGFANVQTYIQSGNVIFDTPRTSRPALEKRLESLLEKRFTYTGMVLVLTTQQVRDIIKQAPPGFGAKPELYRYDVIFLQSPLTAATVAANTPVRDGVDTITPGKRAVYARRVIAEAGKSYLSKVSTLPFYEQITIRNWNTTTKLLELADTGS